MPKNKNFNTVGGAYVHVWVMDHALESAQDRALTYIKDRSWTPQEVLNAFEIQQEQISALGKDEENLYLMAQVYGIAAGLSPGRQSASPGFLQPFLWAFPTVQRTCSPAPPPFNWICLSFS